MAAAAGASPLPRSPRVTDELGAALSACATAEAALMRERARASERIEAAAISALDLLGSHAQTPQERLPLRDRLRAHVPPNLQAQSRRQKRKRGRAASAAFGPPLEKPPPGRLLG